MRSIQRCLDCARTTPERSAAVVCPHCGGLLAIEHPAPRARGAVLA
jgi:Zn finger protein HypA/HybF involved in hydrogenase expression